MKPLLRTVLLALSALPLAVLPARACSMIDYTPVQSPGTAVVLGTARLDTVRAGPGTFRWDRRSAGARRRRGAVYGQVVEVERWGGIGGASLRGTAGRAVLVPWEHGPDCRPVPWRRSARWMQPGARGVIVGQLRDRAHWVRGLPTIDVHMPGSHPYPQRFSGRGPPGSPLLTAEGYFQVMEMLPTRAQVDSSATRAYAPLSAWVARHPEAARAFPVASILSHAAWLRERERNRE